MTSKTGSFLTKHFWYYWFPVVFFCGVLFIQSSHAAPENLPPFPLMDKCLHFLAYAVLGALFFRAIRQSFTHLPLWLLMLLSISFAGAYGATDEIHQMFVTTRSADVKDWVADLLGSAAGTYAFYRITKNAITSSRTP